MGVGVGIGEGRSLLTSSGWRPRMPQNALQCARHSLTTNSYPAQSVNSARFEKFCPHWCYSRCHIFMEYLNNSHAPLVATTNNVWTAAVINGSERIWRLSCKCSLFGALYCLTPEGKSINFDFMPYNCIGSPQDHSQVLWWIRRTQFKKAVTLPVYYNKRIQMKN